MHSLSAAAIVLALLTAPNLQHADCGNAADRHAAAAAKVMDALRNYAVCVSASGKQRAGSSAKPDDCAAQIQALDDAHDNFADIVADEKDCQ